MTDPYCYPGTVVLRSKLDLIDASKLERAERRLVVLRTLEGVPAGKFDLSHLRDIHRHLFQDVYDWAGEIRTIEISKGGSQFQFQKYIHTGMADVHDRLVFQNFLKGLDVSGFASEAGVILGDVNYVHPFRDGNGRTQFQYLKLLAENAGHAINLASIEIDA